MLNVSKMYIKVTSLNELNISWNEIYHNRVYDTRTSHCKSLCQYVYMTLWITLETGNDVQIRTVSWEPPGIPRTPPRFVSRFHVGYWTWLGGVQVQVRITSKRKVETHNGYALTDKSWSPRRDSCYSKPIQQTDVCSPLPRSGRW